jgi:hypothetical protein
MRVQLPETIVHHRISIGKKNVCVLWQEAVSGLTQRYLRGE